MSTTTRSLGRIEADMSRAIGRLIGPELASSLAVGAGSGGWSVSGPPEAVRRAANVLGMSLPVRQVRTFPDDPDFAVAAFDWPA